MSEEVLSRSIRLSDREQPVKLDFQSLDDGIEILPGSLDPALIQIGLLLGLLQKVQKGTGDNYTFNIHWFSDPVKYLKNIPSSPELIQLFKTLMGGTAGSALGTPKKMADKLWFPIQNPNPGEGETPKPTGLYIVVTEPGDGTGTRIGLGLLHGFTPVKNPDGITISITPYGYFPILQLPAKAGDDFSFILGSKEHPVELGINITGGDGTFITGSGKNTISFNGLKIAVDIYFVGGKYPTLDLVLLNLKLPGEEKACNRSLIEMIENTSVEEWITMALSVFGAQLSSMKEYAAVGAMINCILEILGLTGECPSVNWKELVEHPGNAAKILIDWFKTIASSGTNLKYWLNDWYCLFHQLEPSAPDKHVTGTGTREAPFSIDLVKLNISEGLTLNLGFTIAAVVQENGGLDIFPGFCISTAVITPVSGLNNLGITLNASTEILQLTIPADTASTGNSMVFFPSLHVAAAALNTEAGKPLISFNEKVKPGDPGNIDLGNDSPIFSLDTIELGFQFLNDGKSKNPAIPTPYFKLTNVRSGQGAWPVIDLSNFDLKTVEKIIGTIVTAAITDVLDAGDNSYAKSLSAVLGVTAPPSYTGEWPVELLLEDVDVLLKQPLGAVGAYYTRCLKAKDREDGSLWKYLLDDYGVILGGSGTQTTGSGTKGDPWQIELLKIGPAGAYLQAWQADDTGQQLNLGILFGIPVPVSSVSFNIGLSAHLMSVQLPAVDGTGNYDAHWMQAFSAGLKIAGKDQTPLSTPSLAGISLELNDCLVEAGWNRASNFYVDAVLEDVKLKSKAVEIDLGNIELTSMQWSSKQLEQFAPGIINALGLLGLQYGGRAGLSLTAVLGLLPNLPSIIDGKKHPDYPFDLPGDLKLPDNWPVFEFKTPSNPWLDVKTQLNKIYSGGTAFVEPVMQLLGWTVTGQLPQPPSPLPAGTVDDPWSVLLPNLWNLELITWLQDTNQLGFGVQRTMIDATVAGVAISSKIRLDIPGFVLDGPGIEISSVLPRLGITAKISNPEKGKPLYEESSTGFTIGYVEIGVYVQIENDSLYFAPVLVFRDSRLSKPDKLSTFEITKNTDLPSYDSPRGIKAINTLLNGLMNKLSGVMSSASFEQLEAFLAVLGQLGIVQVDKNDQGKDVYGFNPGTWTAVLANPGAYFTTKTKSILENPLQLAEFFDNIAKLIGFKSSHVHPSLNGVQYLLEALGLLKSYNGTFVPVFHQWIDLLRSPVKFLKNSVADLFNDKEAIKKLVSELSKIVTLPSNPFSVDASGKIISIGIPTGKPVSIGNDIKLYASLDINLTGFKVTASAALGSEILDSALSFSYTPSFSGGKLSGDFAFLLESLPGTDPVPFPPLQLFPFPEDTAAYLKRLGIQVPLSVLSAFSAQMLNEFVLPNHPTVLNIFKALGLVAVYGEENPKEQVKPLLGIFMNPIGWALSKEVIGDGKGNIDLSRLGNLLYTLTDAAGISFQGIALKPYKHNGSENGIQLTGLPYGVTMTMYSDTDDGVNLGVGFKPTLPAPAPAIEMGAGIGFGTGSGVNISGSAGLSFNLGGKGQETETQVVLSSAYNKGAFTLDISGKYKNKPFPKTIKLIPFGGLNQFIPDAGDTAFLLKMVGDGLFWAYDNYKKKYPGTALVTFVESLKDISGIKDGETLYNFFDNIYKNPLGAFDESNIEKTIQAMNKLVTEILKLKNFEPSSDGKMLLFKAEYNPRENNPLKGSSIEIKVGVQKSGSKTLFGLWIGPKLQVEWFTLGLDNTGLGIQLPIPADLSKIYLEYSVELALGTDFGDLPEGLPTPTITAGITGNLSGITGPVIDVYPVKQSEDKGTLYIELLPTPQLAVKGEPAPGTLKWLEKFAVDFLVPFLADIALSIKPVKTWLSDTKIGQSTVTPGKILIDWGLLNENQGTYTLADLGTVFDINHPVEIITKLLFAALDALSGQTIMSIKNKAGKVIGKIGVVTEDPDKDNTVYGLSVQVQDIVVYSGSGGKSPKLVLQLGKWYADQKKGHNWIGNTEKDPGIEVFCLKRNNKTDALSFNPKIELLSLGIDFDGANEQTPLVNIKGFSIGAIEPRVYVSLDLSSGTPEVDFGAGVLAHQIGLPLGPGFNQQGKSTNPVAQNLLSSGGDKGKTDAVNPAFSASVSYVYKSKDFQFQLYDKNDQPAEKVWIPMQRAFGPLQCKKIGMGWTPKDKIKILWFLFDGNVALAGLEVDLEELQIGMPVTAPTKFDQYKLDLAGLDISFQNGPVSITGGFLKDVLPGGDIQYTGQASILAQGFGLGAFGSYAVVTAPGDDKEYTSLFIFAYLDAPIGGPPYFQVSGLSGGFGFNRKINIPRANDMASFPFVAGIDQPQALGARGDAPPTNMDVLKKLGTTVVPPERGTYWLAAGIKFTSCKLLNAKVVAIVEFGNDFEVQLIGLAGIKLPKTGKTYVGAELAIKVGYKDSTGLFAAEAALTSNSYVIDPACKLTGGFAFYIWLKDNPGGASAGESILTLGGYSPYFKVKPYYPTEPRLGISWHVSGNVSIEGGAYFALTPSCVMAGGSLELLFHAGNLKAWFTAHADFLMSWKPFHYLISIGISVGASYTVHFIWTTTFKIELGADLTIWGPPTAGIAKVNWWVISFTVHFGDQNYDKKRPHVITEWSTFADYFLPEDHTPSPPPPQVPPEKTSNVAHALNAASAVKVQQVTQIHVNDGLVNQYDSSGTTAWDIRADKFKFSTHTQIPLNQIVFDSLKPRAPLQSETKFGIKPMGSVTLSYKTPDTMSSYTIGIIYYDDPVDLNTWDIEAAVNGVPESLWGTVNDGDPTTPSSNIIKDALVGIQSAGPVKKTLPPGPPYFPITNFEYFPLPVKNLPLISSPLLHPDAPVKVGPTSLQIIEKTIMDPGVMTRRESILAAILELGIDICVDGRLDIMAAYAEILYQSPPMLGELGCVGQSTGTTHGIKVNVESKSEKLGQPVPLAGPPRLLALIRHFSRTDYPSPTAFAGTAAGPKNVSPVKGVTYHTGTFASQKDISALQGCLVPGNAGKRTVKQKMILGTGETLIWDIPEGNTVTLEIKGDIPARIVMFDRGNTFITEKVVEKGEWCLPEETGQLVVTGLRISKSDPSLALGWHSTGSLILVNPNALLGEGVIVIPQNPALTLSGKRFNKYGTIRGKELIQQNLVEVGENEIKGGKIETIFPAGIKTAAVLVRKENEDAAGELISSVEARAQLPDKQGLKYQTLDAVETMEGEHECAVLFAIPDVKKEEFVPVYVGTSGGWVQTGIMGIDITPDKAAADWKNIVLKPPAALAGDGSNQKTTIQLISTREKRK